jgi:peptidoglycan/LPS O-acetylase OafA/YrhL
MPLLFVLAGAATWLALGHRSRGEYRSERFKRLLIPFLFGLLVIVPPQAFLAQRFRDGTASIGSFLGEYWTVEGDLTGYTGSWTPAHLWFIGFLFVFSLLALPLFARWRQRPVRATWLLFAMPIVLLLANELPAPNEGAQNPWYSLALFVAGFLLIADERAERLVHRHWRSLLVGAAATMTTMMLIWSSGVEDRLADMSFLAIAGSVLEQVNTWVWVLALLGVAKAFLGRSRGRVLRYASEGSYPFYLLHQTVIVVVAYVVLGWGLGVWPAYAAVVVASFGITLGLYELGVRRTGVTRYLFGMKPRRAGAHVPVAPEPAPAREPAMA